MTCGHCVNAVTEEVSALPGVTEVDVDLASGGLTVTSDAPVDEAAVRAAVEEAGYEVAGWLHGHAMNTPLKLAGFARRAGRRLRRRRRRRHARSARWARRRSPPRPAHDMGADAPRRGRVTRRSLPPAGAARVRRTATPLTWPTGRRRPVRPPGARSGSWVPTGDAGHRVRRDATSRSCT